MKGVRASRLLEDGDFDLGLSLLAGRDGLDREIRSTRLQKSGLAFTGFLGGIEPDRLQIIGNSEMEYLGTLKPGERERCIKRVFEAPMAAVVVTNDQQPPECMVTAAEESSTPLFVSAYPTRIFHGHVTRFLEDWLSASTRLHGVLLDVLGLGLLILGKPGTGKSEIALDLITRGHRLVADDIVEVHKLPPSTLYGSVSSIIGHHMEIRGLGILNIKELYGISAIRDRKKIELVVELEVWKDGVEYDRLGLDQEHHTVLETRVPKLIIPIRPGRPMGTILEIAARNRLLRMQGYHAAREFQTQLNDLIAASRHVRHLGEEVE